MLIYLLSVKYIEDSNVDLNKVKAYFVEGFVTGTQLNGVYGSVKSVSLYRLNRCLSFVS